MKSKIKVINICMVAIGIVLNIVGAFAALNLRLPIYLDSIGTVLVGAIYGPIYGIATGVLGSLISGITFDIFSLYYAPVQILTGFMAGMLFKTKWMKGVRLPLGSFVLSLPTSIASAMITAFLFGGITSSGSSYIVQILSKLGVNLTVSCFIVQVITDYLDKLVAVIIVIIVLKALPSDLREKIKG